MTFSDTLKGTKEGEQKEIDIDDPALKEELGEDYWSQLMDEIELLDGAADEFDQERVSRGNLSPVFFGSALTNFGVETFLQHFLQDNRWSTPTEDCNRRRLHPRPEVRHTGKVPVLLPIPWNSSSALQAALRLYTPAPAHNRGIW